MAKERAFPRSTAPWVCRARGISGPVVVIGGGAAGLTAAYFAAKAGAEVPNTDYQFMHVLHKDVVDRRPVLNTCPSRF